MLLIVCQTQGPISLKIMGGTLGLNKDWQLEQPLQTSLRGLFMEMISNRYIHNKESTSEHLLSIRKAKY